MTLQSLRKIKIATSIVGIFAGSVVAPIAANLFSKFSAMDQAVAAVDQKVDAFKLEIAKTLATKDDIKETIHQIEALRVTQDQVSQDVARIKGILEREN